ncbi:hypothetical protein Y032_0062g3310 [Ancylostoma ceylanicum]|uniref:SXP/RAL-2 family protein Ani s 5-like cation-binding domain-containing protein n=1 Tax=Ancylostoma ceylanicum TaxID=53326 RepID=A0A016U253_9BILA|nr:hypothetical protein Y032_0062g3310 [Ancylostoma ceylanicum]
MFITVPFRSQVLTLKKNYELCQAFDNVFFQEELHSFDEKKAARFAEIHRNVSKAISELPDAHEQVHKIVTDESLSKDEMIEKLRAVKVDPAVGRSLRGVMFAVAHPHIYGKHHSGHRNYTHASYEGLGPLAAVLGHAGKGDGMLPIGTEAHEHQDFA